ncbi:MAG: GIY-YIG nuclease family protein [bacterium]
MAIRKSATKTTYVLVLFLSRARRIRTGALGALKFEAGLYFCVGSGGRNPEKRIARHARARKKKFWHIDYLSRHARVIGAFVLDASRSLECPIAAALADAFEAVPRFGCSDCTCTSHLFRVRTELKPQFTEEDRLPGGNA